MPLHCASSIYPLASDTPRAIDPRQVLFLKPGLDGSLGDLSYTSAMHSITLSLAFALFIALQAQAAILTYDWNLTWILKNPDGQYQRPTIGINGQWPLPRIEGTLGDRVIVNVDNQLGHRSSSLHFHGIYMNGSTQYDGPVGVSQCSIPTGKQFSYDFNVSSAGRGHHRC